MNYFYDDVTDWLSTGGDLDLARDLTGQDYAQTITQLRDHGVTHVLDVRSEWEDQDLWAAHGLSPANYCHAPIVDSHNHYPSEEWFRDVEDFAVKFWLELSPGDRLYVHCHMGINRGPSAAMVALLTTGTAATAWEAFQMVRAARPAAGLVYAEAVGARQIIQTAEDWTGEFVELTEGSDTHRAVVEFIGSVKNYWTQDRIREVNRGVAFYRSAEGGTIKVG